MKLILLNRQRIRPVRRQALTALTQFLATCAFARCPDRPREITLTLVDDAQIRPLKKRYWHQDLTTDVIAFAYAAPPPAAMGTRLGDVVVNIQQAIQIGAQRGGAAHELGLYIAHGLDHLSGADDDTARQRRRMRRRELAWLLRARASGLLRGLWGPVRRSSTP